MYPFPLPPYCPPPLPKLKCPPIIFIIPLQSTCVLLYFPALNFSHCYGRPCYTSLVSSFIPSKDLDLGSTNKQEHAVFVILGLGYLIQYKIFKFCSFTGNVMALFLFTFEYYCKCVLHFLYLVIICRTLGCFWFLAILNGVAINMAEQVSVE